ncbi:MAG TPA: signal peptidase I [Ardenticatenaceae bacterium]
MDRNLTVSELGVHSTTVAPTSTAKTLQQTLLGEFVQTVLPALLIAAAMVIFVVQPTRVDGTSMEPTLHSGQRLVIEKVSYHFAAPDRGEVVVLKIPGREEAALIKRVVATAGDVIAIRNGRVYLNGAVLEEPYLSQFTPGDLPSTVVPDGYIFVLGDNRGASNDSRTFGMIPTDHLVGRAILSYWPPEEVGPVE